ncbi:unnamed protein product [Peniophora sp. CBMAI 1063]|nr:unnamed protein product [Peniophora sp. CBMAI 1063]
MSPPYQSWRGLVPALAALPPALFALYYYTQFPRAPKALEIHPSLASLTGPAGQRAKEIYPEAIFEGGAYFNAPLGRTRYWLVGPQDGKRVVLIHGLTVPGIIWKDVVPRLVANGCRVLVYDLYGRGYSDAPATTYSAALYATQLALLMQHIGWEKAYITGVSMGGAIATAFNAWYPHLVDGKIVLIATVGLFKPSDMSYSFKYMSSPLYLVTWDSLPGRMHLRHLANSKSLSDPISEFVRIQSAYLKGFNHAVASSIRDGPVRGLEWAFESLASSKTDVLIIHGTNDGDAPYKFAGFVKNLVPRSRLVTVEGGGHDLTLEQPELVSRELVDFFNAN